VFGTPGAGPGLSSEEMPLAERLEALYGASHGGSSRAAVLGGSGGGQGQGQGGEVGGGLHPTCRARC